MNQNSFCPECGKSITEHAKRCTCGWRQKTLHEESDRRCAFSSNDRRCPLLGTMCFSTSGKGTWYCRGHWQTKENPLLAEAILLDAEKIIE